MSIPFFSIDLNLKEKFIFYFSLFNIFSKKIHLEDHLKNQYPNRYINLLPSGRLGFYLSLLYLFKEGDEVIFSSMSFPLYIKIAIQLKLKVKLIDVNSHDCNINTSILEKTITNKTKGVVITHLFGNICNNKEIEKILEKRKIHLIEDCAQSYGSLYQGKLVGNLGTISIFSTSLLKTPTTLSGGFTVSRDPNFKFFVDKWVDDNLSKNPQKIFSIYVKSLIFILNSRPLIYSILTDKTFKFIQQFNPRTYRKILYSGMAVNNSHFDPKERPKLLNYQFSTGLSQFLRDQSMKKRRIDNAIYIFEKIKHLEFISFLTPDKDSISNMQYFVILVNKDYNVFFNELFKRGIHAMEENVWNCLDYNLDIENKLDSFDQAKQINKRLIRIQNNSFLKKKHLDKIIKGIIEAHEHII